MDPTPQQLRIVRALRRLLDEDLEAYIIDIHNLAREVGRPGDVVATDLRLLNEAGLTDWMFASATPWWDPSEGRLTSEGYSLAYWSSWRGRLRRGLPALGASFGAAVVAGLVSFALSPANIQQLVAGIAGGSLGGGLFSRLIR